MNTRKLIEKLDLKNTPFFAAEMWLDAEIVVEVSGIKGQLHITDVILDGGDPERRQPIQVVLTAEQKPQRELQLM